jgi:hypothetical protein
MDVIPAMAYPLPTHPKLHTLNHHRPNQLATRQLIESHRRKEGPRILQPCGVRAKALDHQRGLRVRYRLASSNTAAVRCSNWYRKFITDV